MCAEAHRHFLSKPFNYSPVVEHLVVFDYVLDSFHGLIAHPYPAPAFVENQSDKGDWEHDKSNWSPAYVQNESQNEEERQS